MIAKTKLSERLAPLGLQRLRISTCLGGGTPGLPQYFAPEPHEDVFAAFRRFVERSVCLCESASDPITRSLIGAARLLAGDVSGADEVVAHLPATPFQLDHGAGYCLMAPQQALRAALPQLPATLLDTSRWLAGSTEQAALRGWLEQHAGRLVWDEVRAVYEVGGIPVTATERGK
jgi:hypothetical protein